MTERIERAYYLKEEELAVLLAIMDVHQLYGFQMNGCADIKSRDLHEILFGMARKGILSSKDGRPRIYTDMEIVLKDIAGAENVLILAGREECPESCIYAGSHIVFVQLLGQSGRIYRIESTDREKAVLKMQEYGWRTPGAAADVQVGTENEEVRLQMQKQAGILYHMDKESLLQKKEILCALMQYSVRQSRKIRQLLILNGVLEDYITVSDGEQDSIYLYSHAKARELLGQLIGDTI